MENKQRYQIYSLLLNNLKYELSAGGGVSYDFLAFKGTIDYAYRNWGRLTASHLVSLTITF